MTTIKVKLCPSCIQGKAWTINYQVTHCRAVRQISTNLHVLPENWDEARQRIAPSDDIDRSILQTRIDCGLSLLSAVIKKMESAGVSYTIDDIVRHFKTPDSGVSFLSFMKEQIDHLRCCNQFGTARNYERTMQSLAQFSGGDIAIMAIDEQLIENYNAYLLRRGIVRNSISFYMRILRAVYNKAVRRHLAERTNPFQNVYTGIDKTRKRAVDEKIIAKICKLNLSGSSRLELARDIFIFSYCARGMAFVDIAYLKKKNVVDGIIHYARHKTGQLLSVRIEPNMQNIISRYSELTKDSSYMFPILNSSDEREAYNQYRKAINVYNRCLGKLSQMLSLQKPITSYTSRHSWANAARKHNAPISVISAGLGHTSENTTQIYLTSLENGVIDAVNQGIISILYE